MTQQYKKTYASEVQDLVFGEDFISELELQRWKISYYALREAIFSHIVEVLDGLHTIVMKQVTVLFHTEDCFIELIHRDSDPSSWIVRRWKKFLWFKRRLSSDWFNDRQQALAFVDETKRGRDIP